jgi:hypothetical protein
LKFLFFIGISSNHIYIFKKKVNKLFLLEFRKKEKFMILIINKE